jgi:hypothetical protein
MTRVFLLIFLVIQSPWVFSQEIGPAKVKNAPSFFAWSVKIKNLRESIRQGSTEEGPPQVGLATDPLMLTEIEIDKMGTNRREVYHWSDKNTSEKWYYEGMIFIEDPKSHEILVMAESRLSRGESGIFTSYQTAGDFPELSWVNASTYKRDEVKNGRRCRRYERDASPMNQGGQTIRPSSAMIAWIDSESGFPAASESAEETRTYTVKELLRADLPANFRHVMEEYRRAFAKPER